MANVTVELYVNERSGKRLSASEKYQRKNQSGGFDDPTYGRYTVWLKDDGQYPDVQEGTVIVVNGTQQVQQVEKDGAKYTNVNINFARVWTIRQTKGGGDSGGGQRQQPKSADEPWGQHTGQSTSGWATPGQAQGGDFDSPPF